jgi:predicted ferric reductase
MGLTGNTKLWWYVARSSGLVAWWLVAASVFWGLLLSTRLLNGKPRPSWLLDLHRFISATAIVFIGLHLGGLAADNYTHFGWSEIFVPLASKWRPGPVAWGVVSLYLLAAIELTSLVRKHIPNRLWRSVHLGAFPLFMLITVHAFVAGTDHGNAAVQWSALGMVTLFVFLTVYRQLTGRPAPATRTAPRTPRPAP